MNHVIEKGNSRNVIFLLHGTGGDASDLIGIGKMIDEQATLIGLEGNVFEQGMRRFFRRFPDGRFDMKSLKEETEVLYQTINQLMNHYRLENNNIVLLGYSNGANIAINLLKEFETQFNLAILLHPSLGRGEVEFKKQKNLSIFMTSGQNDPYISGIEFEHLVGQAKTAGIETKTLIHEHGHKIITNEIQEAKNIYNKTLLKL